MLMNKVELFLSVLDFLELVHHILYISSLYFITKTILTFIKLSFIFAKLELVL